MTTTDERWQRTKTNDERTRMTHSKDWHNHTKLDELGRTRIKQTGGTNNNIVASDKEQRRQVTGQTETTSKLAR